MFCGTVSSLQSMSPLEIRDINYLIENTEMEKTINRKYPEVTNARMLGILGAKNLL